MDFLDTFNFFDSIFRNEKVFVGKVKGKEIFFVVRSVGVKKDSAHSYQVFWYNKDASDKSELPFVDVLDLVEEEVSNQLIFNMDFFLNKRS